MVGAWRHGNAVHALPRTIEIAPFICIYPAITTYNTVINIQIKID
jgi:hypothetical protein